MAGKWGWLKGKYEATIFNKDQASDETFRGRVETVKTMYSSLALPELLVKHEEARKLKEELAEKEGIVNAELAGLSILLNERFLENGINSLHTDFGRTVSLSVEPYVSVEDPQAARRYFTEHQETGVTLVPNSNSLTSWVKGLLDANQDEAVPKFLKIFLKTTVKSKKT